jgi:hypothetical protein
MNCPSTEQWNLLSMNLIGRAEEAELLAHARDCDVCRTTLQQARRDHSLLLQSAEVFNRCHDRLREELMAAVPAELPPRALRLDGGWRSLRGLVPRLDTPARRAVGILAPAACILITVGVLLTPGKSAVALAAALERMRQARTMVCDLTTVSTTVFEAENRSEERTYRGKLSMYSDGDVRAWRLDNLDPPSTQWTFPDRIVTLDAAGERTVVNFAEHPNPHARCESPEWWLTRLLELAEVPDRKPREELLEGRRAVMFEIAGWKLGYGVRPASGGEATPAPTPVVRLWVDAGTRLPVRMSVKDVVAFGMPGVCTFRVSMTWKQIQWDMPLDPRAFQPPPPAAGAPVEELEVRVTEQQLLDGLRGYAAEVERIKALLGGRYADLPELMERRGQVDDPEAAQDRAALAGILEVLAHGYPQKLDMSCLVQISVIGPSMERAAELAAQARGDADALARLAERRAAARQERDALSRKVSAMLIFYRQLLVEDREPEYFGATVEPGDSTAVLMRWKLDDNGMRVVYGDLHVETVPSAELGQDTP